jgi:RHS repeat-associated protein
MTKKRITMIVAAVAILATQGVQAEFTCSASIGESAAGSLVRTGTVIWENVGSTGIAAPYVRVTAGEGVLIRFTDADAWGKSIEFLAASASSPCSILKANESGSLLFSCQADSDDKTLELSWMTASGETFPWPDIGSALKPSYVTDDAWAFALVTLKSRLGTTWNSYLSRLRANLDYLAENGRPVNRLDRLLQIEINNALGIDSTLPVLAVVTDAARSARGLGLSFTRSYSSAMYGRFNKGILGYGWTDNLSTYAELSDDKNTLVFRTPGGGSYAFTKATGSWQPEDARDKSVLAESSSAYTLTYQSGTVQTFAKSNMRTASIADNSGNKLTFTWSGTTLQNIAHTDGQSLTFGYSGGLLSSVTDDCGRRMSYSYSSSLLTKVTAPDGLETLYEYRAADGTAAARALSRIIYPDGTTREFAYDTASGLVSAISVNGGKEKTTISRDGLNVSLTGPDGAATIISMGVSGEVLKTTDALGGVATNGYTEDGLLKSVVSPSGLTGSISHDALGRVGKSVSANGAETAFAYEETFGNLKTVTDANGHAVTYGYDEQGRGKSVTFADGSSSTIEYNDRGDVLKSTNRRGQSISYEYDSQGRIKKKTWSNGRTFAYAYDEEGNLVAASDSETGQVSMYYIVGGRLRCIFYPNGRAIFYDYDGETGKVVLRKHGKATVTGRPQSPNPEYEIWQEEFSLEYDEDSAEAFAYDASGRLASVADGNGNFYLKNTYDATTGRLSKQENGNGTSVSYLYDKLGRVVSIEHRGADGNIAESLQYCYDADGRCIRAASLFGEERYTYDKDGQLTAVDYPEIEDETFAYDAVGNRTTANGATYSVKSLNQYTAISDGTSMSYDRDGNLISMTDAKGTTTYTYDTLNRLVAVSNPTAGINWSCTYDVFGNRVSVTDNGVTTERTYLQGSLPSVAAEYVNGELKERHIVVGAVRIADLTANNASPTTHYYHADLIGSTRLVTDGSGAVVDRRAYKAFGETRVETDTTATAGYVGTLGVETDSTGLLFMRNRYYSPALGRFVQMDPIGLNGGDVNWYRYCGNMVETSADVNGLWRAGLSGFIGKGKGWSGSVSIGTGPSGNYVACFSGGGGYGAGGAVGGSFSFGDLSAGMRTKATVGGAYYVGPSVSVDDQLMQEFNDGKSTVETLKDASWDLLFGMGASATVEVEKCLNITDPIDPWINQSMIADVNEKFLETLAVEMPVSVEQSITLDTAGGGGSVDSGGGSGGGGSGEGGGGSGGESIGNLTDWMNKVLSADGLSATYSLGSDIVIDVGRGRVVGVRYNFPGATVMGYTDEGYEVPDDVDYGTELVGGPMSFSGTLDGNGHTITVKGGYLFNSCAGAKFRNVVFAGDSTPIKSATGCSFEGCSAQGTITSSGGSYLAGIAALVGSAYGCTFENCSSSGSVVGDKYVGGLVGYAVGSTFTDCTSSCMVKGSQLVGGLVGSLDDGTEETPCIVKNCKATGTVSGRGWTGGLAGAIDNCKVSNSTATGNVMDDATITAVSNSDDYFGGFVGHVTEGSTGGSVIELCNASGSVTASGAKNVGGFAGKIDGNHLVQSEVRKCSSIGNVIGGNYVGGFVGDASECTISDCYAAGAATSQGINMQSNAGGLIGSFSDDCALSRCYASGKITISSSATMAYSGGLMPLQMSADMLDMYASMGMLDMMISSVSTSSTSCYWNKTTTGQNYSGTGTGLSDAQAKNQSSYSGWDFGSVWKMGANGPELQDIGAQTTSSTMSMLSASIPEGPDGNTPRLLASVSGAMSPSASQKTPRLYCYERYVVVKDSYYEFALSADDDSAISVSGLPSGFSFASGRMVGTASAVGTAIVTITAQGSSGTATKCVPFVVIDAPTGFLPLLRSWTVTFNANGGSGSMTAQTFTQGEGMALKVNAFSKTGFAFMQWKGSDGKTYRDGQTITLSDDLVLTAQWKWIQPSPAGAVLTVNDSGVLVGVNLGDATEIAIPEGVTAIGAGAFAGQSGLVRVTIPPSVKSIGAGAFMNCAALTEVLIPEGVERIGERAFYGCKAISSVAIPGSVVSVDDYAFARCYSLRSVAIAEGVERIGWFAFAWCSSLTDMEKPETAEIDIGVGASYGSSVSLTP